MFLELLKSFETRWWSVIPFPTLKMLLCVTYNPKFGLKMSVCGARKMGTPSLFKMAGSAPLYEIYLTEGIANWLHIKLLTYLDLDQLNHARSSDSSRLNIGANYVLGQLYLVVSFLVQCCEYDFRFVFMLIYFGVLYSFMFF